MFSTIIYSTILISSASLVAAQTSDQPQFWWSYPPGENYTDDNPYGYDPLFEVCGSSCEECSTGTTGASTCLSDLYTNICYEPDNKETCCADLYGTACLDGYYCAYNGQAEAFCCASGTNEEDCGKLFNETLSNVRQSNPETVVVTATEIFVPPSSVASQSVVARPNRTPPPKVPGGVTAHNNNGTASTDEGLSTGAKIGISIGAFVGAAIIASAIAFFFLRRRRNARYNQIGGAQVGGAHNSSHFPPAIPTNYTSPAPAYAGHAVAPAGPYEPMRGMEQPTEYHAHEYKQPLMTSPQPSVVLPAYHDHPSSVTPPPPQHHGVELAEMPGPNLEVHEMPGQPHR